MNSITGNPIGWVIGSSPTLVTMLLALVGGIFLSRRSLSAGICLTIGGAVGLSIAVAEPYYINELSDWAFNGPPQSLNESLYFLIVNSPWALMNVLLVTAAILGRRPTQSAGFPVYPTSAGMYGNPMRAYPPGMPPIPPTYPAPPPPR